MQERSLAAEVWDAKGLAIPTWELRGRRLAAEEWAMQDEVPMSRRSRKAHRRTLKKMILPSMVLSKTPQ
jgi:hypothetical protein